VLERRGMKGLRRAYGPLFRKVLYPLYESGLRGRRTLRYLSEYERDQWRSADEIRVLQWRKLRALVDHCWAQVPFYREHWGRAGVSGPGDIRDHDDYARLPILTKRHLREHSEALKAERWRDRLLYKTTGGSTGEPVTIGYTRESYERRTAVMLRGYAWAGATLGTHALFLWGQDPDGLPLKERLHHAAFNRRYLNAYVMGEANMADYADAIDADRPEVIVAYVAPLVRLAKWLDARGRRVHAPRSILCAAEPLYPHHRLLIERVFGAPVHNTYGCREVMLIAAECGQGPGLHVNADHLHVELGEPVVADDAEGPREVLVTDLHNHGMPLMRYANGDIATAHPHACPCGRGLPLLASVDGRRMDALRTPEGRFVGEYLEYLVFATPGIQRFQAMQHQLDAIDVTLVRGEGFDPAALDTLRERFRQVCGDATQLRFHYADEIPLTRTGKLRVAISTLGCSLGTAMTHAFDWLARAGVEPAVMGMA
jgi:phenylacetate-CoA ligase